MTNNSIEEKLEGLVDTLASIEHERWAHWQKHMHSKCEKNQDGSLTIPTVLVRRWEQQAALPFGQLTEDEKDSDRDQVRRYLHVLIKALKS